MTTKPECRCVYDWDHCFSILEQHGKTIGASADAGNETCKEIIKWYQMLYSTNGMDPMSKAMIMNNVEKWLKEIHA